MLGPGNGGDDYSDADIERLLLSSKDEEVSHGVELLDTRYRRLFAAQLKGIFPGLRPYEFPDAWGDSVTELLVLIWTGKYVARGSVRGLLFIIYRRNAADRFRRWGRWLDYLDYLENSEPPTEVRDPTNDGLEDQPPADLRPDLAVMGIILEAEVDSCADALEDVEQVVLKKYAQLLCRGRTAGEALPLLTKNVNYAIDPRHLSAEEVRSLLCNALQKLRACLETRQNGGSSNE